MQIFEVDGQIFEFPDDWHITKVDEWPTYRNNQISNHKACDILAISDDELVFIEVKDYTYAKSQKQPSEQELARAIAQKVMGSAALLFLFYQGVNGRGNTDERNFSSLAVQKVRKIKVVASVEPSPLPRMKASSYLSDLKQHLRRKLIAYCDEVIVDSVSLPSEKVRWSHRRDPRTRSLHLP